MSETGHRIVVTRKVAKTIRNSAWALLIGLIGKWGLQAQFHVNQSAMELTFRPNDNRILCIGLDDPEKIKSIYGVTGYWHEEPTELTPSDLNQLNLRLRGETPNYKQHLLSFNPISVRHWLRSRFFDRQDDDVRIVKTTYRDNRFLDAEYITELEKLTGNDRAVYRDGEWGVLEGAIYPAFIGDEWPRTFDETIYGLDFGFNNPMALVRCDLRDAEAYLTELVYERGMTTSDVISRLDALDVHKSAPIYADAAEPDRIEEVCRAGYNCKPAAKGQGSVQAGIAFCQAMKIHTAPGNENLNAENGSYRWRVDKDGQALDEPEKDNDHLMDAMRYALFTHLSRQQPAWIGGGIEVRPW